MFILLNFKLPCIYFPFWLFEILVYLRKFWTFDWKEPIGMFKWTKVGLLFLTHSLKLIMFLNLGTWQLTLCSIVKLKLIQQIGSVGVWPVKTNWLDHLYESESIWTRSNGHASGDKNFMYVSNLLYFCIFLKYFVLLFSPRLHKKFLTRHFLFVYNYKYKTKLTILSLKLYSIDKMIFKLWKLS